MDYTPIEIDAVWGCIRDLQSRHGITESDASDRVLEKLDRAGRPLAVAELKKHRTRPSKPDTDIDDIGREMLERGLDWDPPAYDDDARTWADQHLARLENCPEAFAAVRESIGITVVSALFRRIIPGLPDRKWEAKTKSRSIKLGHTIIHLRPLCKAGHIEAHDHTQADLLIGRTVTGYSSPTS